MTGRWHCPLWVHVPLAALVGMLAVRFVQAWPLPPSVPLQFSPAGEPVRWGSPWEIVLVIGGTIVVMATLGVWLAEVWARQEKCKTFNWFTVAYHAIVAALVVMAVQLLEVATQDLPRMPVPWLWLAVGSTATALAAALLEWLRPHRPRAEVVVVQDGGGLGERVAERMRSGWRWAYWESQNPWYVAVLSLGLVAGMTALAVISALVWGAWLLAGVHLLVALVGVVLYGGLRTVVTDRALVVRLGLLGVRLLRVPLGEVQSAQVRAFHPLGDFGGWGPGRWGRPEWAAEGGRRRGVWAFYFRGTRGLQVVAGGGRVYLIGSDTPEMLCDAVHAAAKSRPAG